MTTTTNSFFRKINNPVQFRLFLLRSLPAAFFAGLHMVEATPCKASVSVPYKWFTQNPFRSTYFACLSMAAEMSTGVLAMAATRHQGIRISMLIVGLESQFHKKATGRVIFTCEEGKEVAGIVKKAVDSNISQIIKVKSVGFNQANEPIATFWFTWSFKVRAIG